MITILEKENACSKKVMTARALNSARCYNTYVFTADKKGRFSALGYDRKVLSLYGSNATNTHENTIKEFIDQGYHVCCTEGEKELPVRMKSTKENRKGIKTCAECGKPFKPRNGRVKYCSNECREKHTKERLRMRCLKAKPKKEQIADEN